MENSEMNELTNLRVPRIRKHSENGPRKRAQAMISSSEIILLNN